MTDALELRVARDLPTLRDLTTDKLREAIMAQRFKPGQHLVERDLCEQTGVSRSSVRIERRSRYSSPSLAAMCQSGKYSRGTCCSGGFHVTAAPFASLANTAAMSASLVLTVRTSFSVIPFIASARASR